MTEQPRVDHLNLNHIPVTNRIEPDETSNGYLCPGSLPRPCGRGGSGRFRSYQLRRVRQSPTSLYPSLHTLHRPGDLLSLSP